MALSQRRISHRCRPGLLLSVSVVYIRGASSSDAWQYLCGRSRSVLLSQCLGAQRRGTSPKAETRRLSAFAGISALAMVHQVREHCGGLLSDVIGSPGGGYAGLAAGAGWMKEGFELLGVRFEDRGRLTDEYPGRRSFTGTSDGAASCWPQVFLSWLTITALPACRAISNRGSQACGAGSQPARLLSLGLPMKESREGSLTEFGARSRGAAFWSKLTSCLIDDRLEEREYIVDRRWLGTVTFVERIAQESWEQHRKRCAELQPDGAEDLHECPAGPHRVLTAPAFRG
jgi:hypothetical protein